MWMTTIQQDLKSNNLSQVPTMNEANDMAHNCPLKKLLPTFDATVTHCCMSEMNTMSSVANIPLGFHQRH